MEEPYKMSQGEAIFFVGLYTALMLVGAATIYTAFKINQYADRQEITQEYKLDMESAVPHQ